METFSKIHTLKIDSSPIYASILCNWFYCLFNKLSAGTVTITAVMKVSNRSYNKSQPVPVTMCFLLTAVLRALALAANYRADSQHYDYRSRSKMKVVPLLMVMLLHVNWHFLLNVHRNFNGVWLRDVHRDGIRLRDMYVVRNSNWYLNLNLDGIRHFLFYDEWNFLLNINRIRLRNFNWIGLLDFNLNRDLHWVRDLFLHRDWVRLRNRIFYFLCDDGGLDMVLLFDLVSLVLGKIVICEMLSEDAPLHHGPAVF